MSKVLRNAYGASPEMQTKVRRAIDELGYRPHAGARGLRGQTYTIGVMLPDIRNPFFPEVLDGITRSLEDTEYQVLLGPGCNGEKAEAKVTEAMIDRGMDGLILVAPVSSRTHLEHVASAVPTVVAGRHGSSPVYDTVVDDDVEGASLVVGHLAALGHRRIAHRPQRATAVFAGADVVAMGMQEAVTEAGLSVPADISVARSRATRRPAGSGCTRGPERSAGHAVRLPRAGGADQLLRSRRRRPRAGGRRTRVCAQGGSAR